MSAQKLNLEDADRTMSAIVEDYYAQIIQCRRNGFSYQSICHALENVGIEIGEDHLRSAVSKIKRRLLAETALTNNSIATALVEDPLRVADSTPGTLESESSVPAADITQKELNRKRVEEALKDSPISKAFYPQSNQADTYDTSTQKLTPMQQADALARQLIPEHRNAPIIQRILDRDKQLQNDKKGEKI